MLTFSLLGFFSFHYMGYDVSMTFATRYPSPVVFVTVDNKSLITLIENLNVFILLISDLFEKKFSMNINMHLFDIL